MTTTLHQPVNGTASQPVATCACGRYITRQSGGTALWIDSNGRTECATDAEENTMIIDFTTDERIAVVTSQADLEVLRQRLGLRLDWHEPGEQDVTVEYAAGEFDNALVLPGVEAGVYILRNGERVAYVNLALLFAFATGHYTGL
jgi:hypothetical protein